MHRDVYSWDEAAKAAGVDIDKEDYVFEGLQALNEARPFGPRRHPSPRCESGKRPYCTCDTCF